MTYACPSEIVVVALPWICCAVHQLIWTREHDKTSIYTPPREPRLEWHGWKTRRQVIMLLFRYIYTLHTSSNPKRPSTAVGQVDWPPVDLSCRLPKKFVQGQLLNYWMNCAAYVLRSLFNYPAPIGPSNICLSFWHNALFIRTSRLGRTGCRWLRHYTRNEHASTTAQTGFFPLNIWTFVYYRL